jgi:PAS domain S-box-containing protein
MDRIDRPAIAANEDARYRLLVDAITDYAVYMLDRDGFVSSWNAGARRFKGYEAGEIMGEHFSRFYTPEDRANGLPERALRIAATEGRFEHEGWRVRKDGSRFWAHVMIDPIRSPTGELLGFAKVTRDLTERRKAEEALRRSEEQLRILIQGVTDYAIFMLDPDGCVASWNAGAQRIKGYLPEEIIGQHFSRFYTPEDRERGLPAQSLDKARREGRFETEGWRVRKDGTRFWSNVVIDAISSPDGKLIGFAKVTRDITEKLEAARALEEARDALAQAQKMEAIGQLTGGIAHDFNNLLMAVIGSLELVRKRIGYDPRLTPLIDNAMQGAQRGATLTQRMLAFARRQPLDLRPIAVPALVSDMSNLLRSALGPEFRIEPVFPRDLPAVRSDASQLETALLNLVINARDAMPDGGQIGILAREERVHANEAPPLKPGRYVRLSVIDRGQGMDKETLARAAQPFFTTKGVGKGTGLGLSMVHGMAEQSGGRLVLKSAPGQGTTAELWLPVSEMTPKEGRRAEEAAGDLEAPLPARPLTVLAVDDDDLVLNNTMAMLEDLGYRAIAARSGTQALDLLNASDVDLVISDEVMPEMRGSELAALIRRRWPNLPFILTTGYAETLGESDVPLPRLDKPFRQSDLARALDDTLSLKGQTHEPGGRSVS